MAVERIPLSRWRYPDVETMENRRYPEGRPPFAPFPTVTNLMNATLCPVAVLHDMMHGSADALIADFHMEKVGNLFHRFIAYLKRGIITGQLSISRTNFRIQVMRLFIGEFSQREGFTDNESHEIWRDYVEPWVVRKFESGELYQLSNTDRLFFEVHISHPTISFPLREGVRHYPLRGEIDEIDLTRNRIIERTIRGQPSDTQPPLLKDYQVWLYGQILNAMDSEQLPSGWPLFRNFPPTLIVETPYRDFVISPHPDFITWTHWAYAWINDITLSESPNSSREIYENAQCSPENPHTQCRHPWRNCFPHNYLFPQARPVMRREFRPWFRALLWEQIWRGHLWHYQLVTLEPEELQRQGLVLEARVTNIRDDLLEVEPNALLAPLIGYDRFTIIFYGTLFAGLWVSARIAGTRPTLWIRVDERLNQFSTNIFILPGGLPAPIIPREPLTFLQRQEQHSLFLYQHFGCDKEEESQKRSIIQLNESIFGIRPLQREPQSG